MRTVTARAKPVQCGHAECAGEIAVRSPSRILMGNLESERLSKTTCVMVQLPRSLIGRPHGADDIRYDIKFNLRVARAQPHHFLMRGSQNLVGSGRDKYLCLAEGRDAIGPLPPCHCADVEAGIGIGQRLDRQNLMCHLANRRAALIKTESCMAWLAACADREAGDGIAPGYDAPVAPRRFGNQDDPVTSGLGLDQRAICGCPDFLIACEKHGDGKRGLDSGDLKLSDCLDGEVVSRLHVQYPRPVAAIAFLTPGKMLKRADRVDRVHMAHDQDARLTASRMGQGRAHGTGKTIHTGKCLNPGTKRGKVARCQPEHPLDSRDIIGRTLRLDPAPQSLGHGMAVEGKRGKVVFNIGRMLHFYCIALQFGCISCTIWHPRDSVNLFDFPAIREGVMANAVVRRRKHASSDAVEAKRGDDRLFIDSLARGLQVLEAFSEAPRPMSLAEISSISGIDRSGVQRIVHTLTQLGYLERTAEGALLGRKLLDRSFDYLRTHPVIQQAIPILADLRRAIKERVDLSLFDDTTMLYVARMQSKRDTFYAHLVGRRVPTFCSSGGRAVLSHLPDDRIMDILLRSDRLKLTPRTTTEIDDILEKIEQVRASGYSLALEEVQVGEVAVAAAVLGRDRAPIGAIHVAGSLAEWSPEEFVARAGPLVTAAARGLYQD